MWGGIRIEHSSQHQLGAKSYNIQAVFHYAKEEHHELPSSVRAETICVPAYPGFNRLWSIIRAHTQCMQDHSNKWPNNGGRSRGGLGQNEVRQPISEA